MPQRIKFRSLPRILFVLLPVVLCLLFPAFSSAGDAEGIGATDLIKAIRDGDNKKAEKLIKRNKDINTQDDYGWTPLTYAVIREDPDLVEMLLSKDADPDLADTDGITPLMLSIIRMPEVFMFQYLPENRRAILAIAHAMIEKGTNLNHADKDGNTPLIYATARRQESLVAALIRKGADPNLADRHGRTPLFFIKHTEPFTWRPPLGVLTYAYHVKRNADAESGWDPEYAAKVAEARAQANVELEQIEARIVKLLTLLGAKDPDPGDIEKPEYHLFESRPQQIFVGKPDGLMDVMRGYYSVNRKNAGYTLLVCVSAEGTVTKAVVLSGLPGGYSKRLREAALGKKYQPAMKDGVPAEFWDLLIGFGGSVSIR